MTDEPPEEKSPRREDSSTPASAPLKLHSVSIDLRFASILARVRERVIVEMRHRLIERHEAGRNELPEEEIEMIARIAGTVCRGVADEALGEAYNLGVERAAKDPMVR